MSAAVQAALARLVARESLSRPEAAGLMRALAEDTLAPALAGAVLAALRAKGETAEELRGFASAMRELALPVSLPAGLGAADVVGTGGDGSGSFNISTGAALLAAACGVPVVKHGNRSVSSRSGSADVLEALGVPLAADAPQALACLEKCGFAFLFAPNFHPAMKAIAPVRRALAVRTVFNVLGPLSNPATPPFSLVGAFDLPTARLMAEALAGLPIERAFVVHGEPGWDEATPVGPFVVFDVRPGEVRRGRRNPLHYGLPACRPADLAGGDATANAAALEAVLTGRDRGPHRDALVLGAGLVLDLTGQAHGLRRGIRRAGEAIESGAAGALLAQLRAFAKRQS
ncbi:MAG: anthranilate phosphoribosyltransferase [Gammaproteobacteria bacterium]|nr:anthranilate phosphoribosyltransferase [Gammaproteobacteria bacterium]